MFMLKGAFVLFMSLALGYILCILAKKQEGVLKTLGYTLGISILALSLLAGAMESIMMRCMKGGPVCGMKYMKAMKCGTNWRVK